MANAMLCERLRSPTEAGGRGEGLILSLTGFYILP